MHLKLEHLVKKCATRAAVDDGFSGLEASLVKDGRHSAWHLLLKSLKPSPYASYMAPGVHVEGDQVVCAFRLLCILPRSSSAKLSPQVAADASQSNLSFWFRQLSQQVSQPASAMMQ